MITYQWFKPLIIHHLCVSPWRHRAKSTLSLEEMPCKHRLPKTKPLTGRMHIIDHCKKTLEKCLTWVIHLHFNRLVYNLHRDLTIHNMELLCKRKLSKSTIFSRLWKKQLFQITMKTGIQIGNSQWLSSFLQNNRLN